MLEIRLLGPLEVRDGERTIEIRRQKQRALLAVLALDAGRVLSKDGLVDRLWGEQAPAGAAHALENYVSQLRKLLGAGTIETRAPGYVLDVEPEQVDALRLERLVREHRPEEALALVRGAPLADVAAEPFAPAEIARLEELELAAREGMLETRLGQGRHAEAIAELERLVAAEPYRERLRALLMLALYRSGRQADALAAYRNARDALVDGLGIEPGAELQALERAILRQDESLRAPDVAPPASAVAPAPRPARKTVTVLFALLPEKGRLDPEALDAVRERDLAVARSAVERHGGRVEQTLGDALVAVFGIPRVREDDARCALEAAEELGGELDVRVGLATGEVFAGDGKLAGEPLADAEQLARAAAQGEIALADATRSLAVTRRLRLDSPLVGRRRQLAALSEALAAAVEDRTCQLFTVLGAAGVGKSRLLEEFLAGLDEATVMREPGDAPDGPAVVAVEDLHAAEPALLDSVESLAERARRAPLLIVCTARPELLDDRPAWGGGKANTRSILLEPLSEEESEQLMDNLLGDSDLPAIVRRYVVGAAEGNPLFLEEFLGSLIDRGVLRLEGGTWTTQELPSLAVPPTIQALLAARIDRLPDDERQVLELASVEGRRFRAGTVAGLAPETLRERVESLLASLVRRELIVEDREEEGTFAFRHLLLRDAAYGSIPKRARAEAHERLGGDDHRAQARKLRADLDV